MSLNISKNEYLTHLIYNHLKENGFQDAADELRKNVPQWVPRTLSTSLFEIFNKWFSDFILETDNTETTQENTIVGLEGQKSSRKKLPTSAPVKAIRHPKDKSGGKKIQSQENDAINTTNHVPADDSGSSSAEESQSLLPQTPHTLKSILKSPPRLLVAASPRKGTQAIVPLKTTISGDSVESTGVSSDSQEETPVTKATSTSKGVSKAALKANAKPAQNGPQATSTPAPVKAQKPTPKSKTKAIPTIPFTPVLTAKPDAVASSAAPKPAAAVSRESSDSSSDSSDSSLDSENEATPKASTKPLGTTPTPIKAKAPLTAKTSAKASKRSVRRETCSDITLASLGQATKKKLVAEPPITPKSSDKTIKDIISQEELPAVAPTNPAVATPIKNNGTTKDKVKPVRKSIQTPKEKAAKPSAKRKRSKDKAGDAVLKKKKKASVSQTESVLATAPTPPLRDDGSDSDSSLDVEKWKKLALELSDADMAKMDTLDYATPASKKPQVRKPRTKPPPKATSLSEHTPRTGEKDGEANDTIKENTQLKPKRPRAKKAAPATKAVTVQLVPVAAAEEQPQAITSTPEQDGNPKAKRKKAVVTPGADQAENVLSEPKRKKKKKKKDMAEKASETADESATQAAQEERPEEIVKEKKKKKKKDKGEKEAGKKEAEESVNEKLEEQKLREESILELATEIEAEGVNEKKEVKKKQKKDKKSKKKDDQDPLPQTAPELLSHPSEKKKKKHKSKQPEGFETAATPVQHSIPEQIPPNSAIDSPKKKKESSKSKDLKRA